MFWHLPWLRLHLVTREVLAIPECAVAAVE
jgi:hypothetical protein